MMVNKSHSQPMGMTAGVMSTPDRVFVDGAQAPGRGQHYPLASMKDAILPSRCQRLL